MRLVPVLVLLAATFAGCLSPREAAPAPVEPAPSAPGPGPMVGGPVLPGPGLEGPPASRPPELDAARERWDAAGLDSYQMTLRRTCFCPSPDYTGPFSVTVRGGALASVTLDGARVDSERGETIDGLFDLIEDAYARRARTVAVAFDPELGYPTNLSIDYDVQMADEEIGYMVSDVRPARP